MTLAELVHQAENDLRKNYKERITNLTYIKIMSLHEEKIPVILKRTIEEEIPFECNDKDYIEEIFKLRKEVEKKALNSLNNLNRETSSLEIKHTFETEYGSDPVLKCKIEFSALETEDEAKERVFNKYYKEAENEFYRTNHRLLIDNIIVEQIEKFKTLQVSYKIGEEEIKKLFDISKIGEDMSHFSLRNSKLCNKIFEIKK